MAEEEITVNNTISAEEEASMINASKSRVIFKIHLSVFLILNLIIWTLKFTFIDAFVKDPYDMSQLLKLFICITLIWLLIVILHYFIAYRWNRTFVEKQLAKIRKQRAKQLKEIERIKAKIAEAKNKQQNPTE